MFRLIDANELKAVYIPSDIEGFETMMVPVEVVLQNIDDMPTVDAVPVVHGRWIRVYSRPGVFKYLGWTCDQCGQRTGNEYAPQWYKFCPNCGARMDGKGNGNETD